MYKLILLIPLLIGYIFILLLRGKTIFIIYLIGMLVGITTTTIIYQRVLENREIKYTLDLKNMDIIHHDYYTTLFSSIQSKNVTTNSY